MSDFKFPLQNVPQAFTIAMAGTDYLITCRWNSANDAGWILDITNSITNEILATNIPLITGDDCFSGLEYLNFKGIAFVFTDGAPFAVPTITNLGVESNLYFRTDVI